MNKNETIDVTCTDVSDQGYGVCSVNGKTVFVKNLLPGEEATIKIIKDLKKYAIGIVQQRRSTSPDRIEPFCSRASVCGGCAFAHIDYQAQLALKQKQLDHLFAGVSPDIEVLPILGMEEPLNYRNKAQFPIGVKDGNVVSGFYRAHSHDIVDIEECRLQDPRINEAFVWLKHNLSKKQAEKLRHLFIRYAQKSGQLQVVFVGKRNNDLSKLVEKMKKAFPDLVSVVYNFKDGDDNVILGDEQVILSGKDSIDEDCLDYSIDLNYHSFFQVNEKQMEKLYSRALEFAAIQPGDVVIDLYSGTGTIAMLASKEASRVLAVEIVEEAVENMKENLKRNGIDNVEAICMDATEFVSKNREKIDLVLVDPPRKGLSEQGLKDIIGFNPRKIVYVSCNPRTLARDLKHFQENGYDCLKIQPVDMFPWTSHVECIALLEKTAPAQEQIGKSLSQPLQGDKVIVQ